MTETTEAPDAPDAATEEQEHPPPLRKETETFESEAAHYPTDFLFIKVAALLAVLTAVEVSTYFWDFGDAAVPVLLVLMVLKFGTVAMYFMHLKYDKRIFTQLFVAGILLAVGVYLATLAAFEFWS